MGFLLAAYTQFNVLGVAVLAVLIAIAIQGTLVPVLSLEIRIDRRKDWLIVMVRDDGKDFDQEEARSKKSLGLYGMRERAELVGGNVQVLSVAGAGTTIVARLPFLVEKP